MRVGHRLGQLADIAQRYAALTVLAYLVLIGASLILISQRLGVNTDTTDMLSDDLRWRQAQLQFKQAFPHVAGYISVVLESADAADAEQRQRRLAEQAAESRLFSDIYAPGLEAHFQTNGLLYLSLPELQAVSDRLVSAQPLLGRLMADPSLPGFVALLQSAWQNDVDPAAVRPLTDALADVLREAAGGRPAPVAWSALLQGSTLLQQSGQTPDSASGRFHRRYVFFYPTQNFQRLFPAADAMQWLRDQQRQDRSSRQPENRSQSEHRGANEHRGFYITGPVALAHEELETVMQGGKRSAVLLGGVFLLLLLLAYRSVRLTVLTLATVATGLCMTAAFAAVAVGQLNLISIAFAVLYVGLGIDFCLHLCLRYREHQLSTQDRAPAHAILIRQAVENTGPALLICALTTAIGFYAFFPTDFTGVAELGLISGTGMFISFIVNMTLLPALLRLWPSSSHVGSAARPGAQATVRSGLPGWIGIGQRHPRAVIIGSLALMLAAVLAVPQARFDASPMKLRDPDSESVRTFYHLLANAEQPPLSVSVLLESEQAVEQTRRALQSAAAVGQTLDLDSFVPGQQSEKLELIEELRWLMGPQLQQPLAIRTSEPESLAAALRSLDTAMKTAVGQDTLKTTLERYLSGSPSPSRQREVENALLRELPDALQTLNRRLGAQSFDADDLPATVRQRWRSEDGWYRLEVFPRERSLDPDANRDLLEQVEQHAERVAGVLVINEKAGETVIGAFRNAVIYALVTISILLFLLLRRARPVVLILIPIVLTGLVTVAATVWFRLPFNFANVIAIPLLLGISVDNGIHMVDRFLQSPGQRQNLMATSTARGVAFSALTTMLSFGTLALSPHLGMASMGQLLFLGMGIAVICTLLVLPALLTRVCPQ